MYKFCDGFNLQVFHIFMGLTLDERSFLFLNDSQRREEAEIYTIERTKIGMPILSRASQFEGG